MKHFVKVALVILLLFVIPMISIPVLETQNYDSNYNKLRTLTRMTVRGACSAEQQVLSDSTEPLNTQQWNKFLSTLDTGYANYIRNFLSSTNYTPAQLGVTFLDGTRLVECIKHDLQTLVNANQTSTDSTHLSPGNIVITGLFLAGSENLWFKSTSELDTYFSANYSVLQSSSMRLTDNNGKIANQIFGIAIDTNRLDSINSQAGYSSSYADYVALYDLDVTITWQFVTKSIALNTSNTFMFSDQILTPSKDSTGYYGYKPVGSSGLNILASVKDTYNVDSLQMMLPGKDIHITYRYVYTN